MSLVNSLTMSALRLLLVTGLSCAVYAAKCIHPKPMDNFSIEEFSGIWDYGGFEVIAPGEYKKYNNPQCGKINFVYDKEKDIRKWAVDMKFGGKRSDLGGNFTLIEPNKGYFRTFYSAINVTFDYIVICTDYTSWAASYACAHVAPDKAIEFVLFLIRDSTMYDKLVNREDIQKCFDLVLTKPVREIEKVVHDNCPPYKF